jgi:uncharacterized repeat protein (TIGR01451 family)
VSVTTTFPSESFRLITVKADPANAIAELNEGNNEAGQVLQVGQPSFADAVINVQSSSITVCQGAVVTVSGSAHYDFDSVPGTEDFPVQGGRVTVKLGSSATFTGSTTDVNGNFSQSVLAPATDGVYTLEVEVTDETVTGQTGGLTLTVSGICPAPPPPPSPDPGTPPPENPTAVRDVYVHSQDINFSDTNPDVGEPITIFAYIHYFGSDPALGIPVTINDVFPVGGVLQTFQIGSTLIDFPNGGSGSPVVVSIPWANTAAGAHVIQVATLPPFSQYTGNDKATRLIFVGPPATAEIDKSAALLVDADASGSFTPGDTVRYTIAFTNTGSGNLSGATIIDDYDGGLLETPFNITAGGTVSAGTINWNIGTVVAGTSDSVSYDVSIRPPAQFPEGTSVVGNTAMLISDQTPPVGDTVEVSVTNTNTPEGIDVCVSLDGGASTTGGVEVCFSEVTAAGSTTLTKTSGGPPPPSGLKIVGSGGQPVYYNLDTNATFASPVTVCIAYDDTELANPESESQLKLFHDDGSGFSDITTSIDEINNVICGTTTTLSPFAVMEDAPPGPPAVGGMVELRVPPVDSSSPQANGASGSPGFPWAVLMASAAALGLTVTFAVRRARRRSVG